MRYNGFLKLVRAFTKDEAGETAIQTTVLFSVAVILLVIVGVPILNNATQEYAYQKNFGVDSIQTSSVNGQEDTREYVVRKSVLDEDFDLTE